MNIRHFILVFYSYFCTAFVYAAEIDVVCSNGLKIKGRTEDKVTTFSFFDNFSFNNDLPIVFGKISITNSTLGELEFSTKMLNTNFNGANSVRSYKQTFYSEAIDFSYIKIPSNTSISLDVYWSPNLALNDNVISVKSVCEKVT